MLEKFIDNACEDSLTAAVFSHLLHLPCEVFWKILRQACYTKSLPENPGKLLLFHAWPKWNPDGTGNNNYVEPDVFMRFDSFDLIIEAKRGDNDMQNPRQWQRELIAYTNEYGKEKQKASMIALGGINSENDEKLTYQSFECIVHKCRWNTLLLECQRLKREYEEKHKSNPKSRASADVRILDDLIAFFATHGFVALRWFAGFDFKPSLLDASVDSDQQYFQNISLIFRSLL
jgi:hypothetical protein